MVLSRFLFWISLITAPFLAGRARASVELPSVISDHMVLQRQFAAPIWGTAGPGEEVSVSIAGQKKIAKADASGKWLVRLEPLQAAEGLTLTVQGRNTIVVKDVLVGEVWLRSGQSNMAGPIRSFKATDEGLQQALAAAPYPRSRVINQARGGWQLATPAVVDGFSALLFAFGVRLQEELRVPVGLMVGAVGGTPSADWLTGEMLRNDAPCQAQIKEFAATYNFPAVLRNYEIALAAWKKAQAEGRRVGAAPVLPLPAGQSSSKIGGLYLTYVKPYAPFALRGVLWDQGESGSGITGVDQFHAMGALIQGWRKDWSQAMHFLYVQKPSGGGTAWNPADPTTKEASPFAPLPTEVPADAEGVERELYLDIQRNLRTVMVPSTDLGGGTHPVNKTGYADRAVNVALGFVYGLKVETSGPLYASHVIEGDRVRIFFSHIGRGLAFHPGGRLQGFMIAGADRKFTWANAVIDGETVVVSAPARSSGTFQPVAVRYAWSADAPWANFFNRDGLPAQTFRTDHWETSAASPAP